MSDNLSNVEMEKFVLGSMLIRDGEIIPAVTDILSADDFIRPQHRLIFAAIVDLYNDRLPLDALSLVNKLDGKVDLPTIFALYEAAFTNVHSVYYSNQLKELSDRRRLILFGKKLAQDATKVDFGAVLQDAAVSLANFTAPKSNTFSSAANFLFHQFKPYLDDVRHFVNRKTGFDNIDSNQIFAPGLYVLGGTPAAGKTTFAWQLIEQLAARGETCIYCSYEIPQPRLIEKSLARELFQRNPYTSLTAFEIERGGWTAELDNISYDLADTLNNIFVLELQNEYIDDLLIKLKSFIHYNKKPPVICIDYLQFIKHQKDNTKEGIDDTVRKLKVFQRQTNTTFIVVSSFNRVNYNQQVAFESFKESGNIEYTADVVWALQLYVVNGFKGGIEPSKARLLINDAKKARPRQVQLKCLKNRNGGNYDCYFEYFSKNDCFISCDGFEPADDTDNANSFDDIN